MYVLGINGSPRIRGNSDILLDKALEGAKSKGAKIEKVILNKLDMKPCQECEDIRDDGICKIEDDFQLLYRKIKEADALIIVSPIFFGSLSAQTKIMVDRFQCYWKYKYVLKGNKSKKLKPGALILVEASKREGFFNNAKSIIKNLFATVDIEYKEELFCAGLEEKGAVLKHLDFLQRAFELGEKMNSSVIERLNTLGQSIWLDNINRSMLNTGKLKRLIDIGLGGMTSNPTIFDKAISSSPDYDDKIVKLCNLGKSAFEIYDDLTVQDVQDAADIFRPVYKKTEGLDGYVSLEVNPKLAFKVKKSIKEAKRLHRKVNRPNTMFKIPSTKEGFEVIEELIADGINVNVTLIFSVGQYIDTVKAYMRGIKRFIDNKKDAGKIRSVASVFVSRVDTVCDRLLDEIINKEKRESEIAKLKSLKGKAAVANAKLIYKKFREILISNEFQRLKKRGTNIQRVLWGSTSTKDPSYSDIKYVAGLIGKDTVNTIPDETLNAFLDHGEAKLSLNSNIKDAQEIIKNLKRFGININTVCAMLLSDGVAAFEKSFDSLLNAIEEKKKKYGIKV